MMLIAESFIRDSVIDVNNPCADFIKMRVGAEFKKLNAVLHHNISHKPNSPEPITLWVASLFVPACRHRSVR